MDKGINRKSIIVVIIFCLMIGSAFILWPLFKNHMAEESVENRNLAEHPTFSMETISEYPDQYETYLNDHLPFRSLLITANSAIDYYAFHTSSNKDTVLGKDGWLFYNGDATMAIYKGQRLYSEEQLATMAANVQRTSDNLARQGTKYVVMICPEKERIYPEYMPDYYGEPATLNQLDQVVNYLKEHTTVPIVCPYDDLMKAKEEYPDRLLYYKTDSHWNEWGGYIATRALYRELGLTWDKEDVTVSEEKDLPGDLVHTLSLRGLYDCGMNYKVTGFEREGTKAVLEPDFWGQWKYESPNAPYGSIFVQRDSFSTSIAPYIENTFQKSDLVHQKSFKNEMIEENDPDIYVYELVERSMDLIYGYHYNNLTCEWDINNYLDKLIKDKDMYSVFLTVNEDASELVPPEIQAKLEELGCSMELSDMKDQSYAAVIYNGSCLEEGSAEAGQEVSFDGQLENGVTYAISSKGGKEGNSILSYDGADYSMNQPGLNILVYDNQHMVGVDACVLSEGSSLNRR